MASTLYNVLNKVVDVENHLLSGKQSLFNQQHKLDANFISGNISR